VQGDGTSLWTLTHADDFAIGFLGLFGNNLALGETFHITSDEVLTWNQIYQTVAQTTGFDANIVHIPSDYIADYADLHHYPSKRGSLLGDKSYSAVFDNSKIKKFVPTYKANIPFAVGIKNTLHWFESEPTRMIINFWMDYLIILAGKFRIFFENKNLRSYNLNNGVYPMFAIT